MEIAILILGVGSLLVGWFFKTEFGMQVYDYLLETCEIDKSEFEE